MLTNKMAQSKLLIILTASIFALYGVLFILFPVALFEFATDSVLTGNTAVIDVRATYGGMSLAAGIILFLLSQSTETIRLGLLSVLLLMSGMAFGRIVGIVVDQQANTIMYIYLALELIAASLAAFLLMTNKNN